MPIGPQGQKRPADAHRCAVTTMKIATGEIEEKRIDQKLSEAGRRTHGHGRRF